MSVLRMLVVGVLWLTVNGSNTPQQQQQQQTDNTLVFVILEAGNGGSTSVQDLDSSITTQAKNLSVPCVVYSAYGEWPAAVTDGSWTYFPLLNWLDSKHGGSSYWAVIIDSVTAVRVGRLLEALHTHHSSKPVFLGRAAHDREETIIHHFARVDPNRPFLYPDARAGMVLSGSLIKRLAKRWTDSGQRLGSEMNIDAPYEFAKFVHSEGVKLTSSPAFCVRDADQCALLYAPSPSCGKAVGLNNIHFAVKSCEKYHGERLSVLHNTWLTDAPNHAIYSDVQDPSYGTVSLGVPNTERGHCGKTLAIIRHVATTLEAVHWLVIADDDTLISTEALSELLGCRNHTLPVALGERYGYAAATPHGYDYITGGGGMVFSHTLVRMLAGQCRCPSDNTPDDMFLGICLRSLGIRITHSSAFHQARPMDYPPEILEGDKPVSFHKFWMVDPQQVYRQWLSPASTTTKITTTTTTNTTTTTSASSSYPRVDEL